MNCVGIDVSKGKSMIAVMRPFGEVVISPFEVQHTASELSELAKLLKSLDGETRVVMESTGNYHTPVAWLLHDAGFYHTQPQHLQTGFRRSTQNFVPCDGHLFAKRPFGRTRVPIHGQKAFRRKALQGLHDGFFQQVSAYLLRLGNCLSKHTGADLISY